MADDLNTSQGLDAPDPHVTPEPSPPPSIADNAARAYEIAQQRAADRSEGKSVPDALPSLTDKPHRASDGKFAERPKPPTDAGPAKDAKADAGRPAQNAPKTDAAVAAPAADTAPALQPHPRWSEADKASFARLPREAQQSILDMHGRQEADYTRKTQELADQRKQVEPFAQTLGEHADFLSGMSQQIRQPPARIVGDVLTLYRQLATGAPHERAKALGWVAQNVSGIDLRTVFGGQGQAPQQQVSVPEPIMTELQQLRQRQTDFDRFQRDITEERERQSATAVQKQIEDFRNAKDEQGQPKYPYFDAVRGTMADLVANGDTFEDAYAKASQPIAAYWQGRTQDATQTRQASEAQARDAAAAAERDRSANVDRARRASGPRPMGSRPGMTPAQSIDDRASEAMAKVGIV